MCVCVCVFECLSECACVSLCECVPVCVGYRAILLSLELVWCGCVCVGVCARAHVCVCVCVCVFVCIPECRIIGVIGSILLSKYFLVYRLVVSTSCLKTKLFYDRIQFSVFRILYQYTCYLLR